MSTRQVTRTSAQPQASAGPAEHVDVVDLAGEVGAAQDDDVVTLPDTDDDENPLPKHAVRQADGSVRLPLLYPVTLRFRSGGGETREETLEQLVMRRLTGADMRALQSTSNDTVASLAIAKSAKMPPAKMSAWYDRMDAADATAASQVVSHFLGSGRPTGR